jgi:hypothetical protein
MNTATQQRLEVVARHWVIGREVELLGHRVALAVSNALGSEHLSVEEWHDDPEAWAEELQQYAAETLEEIPAILLVDLIQEYAEDLLT